MAFYSSTAVHAVAPVQATMRDPAMRFNPCSTAAPFWEQTIQILSNSSPKRDCGAKIA